MVVIEDLGHRLRPERTAIVHADRIPSWQFVSSLHDVHESLPTPFPQLVSQPDSDQMARSATNLSLLCGHHHRFSHEHPDPVEPTRECPSQ